MTKKHNLAPLNTLQSQPTLPPAHRPQSPLIISFAVWKALFLREANARLSAARWAWMWLLIEPIVHMSVLLIMFTLIRMRVIGGIDTAVWLMMGMLGFFMFKRTSIQAGNAVSANRALFTYRQVKPVDTVLSRALVEGFLMVIVIITISSAASLFEVSMIPIDPLAVIVSFLGLWLTGLGFGLVTSVLNDLVPELGKIIGFMMQPLYLLSGVIIPLSSIPQPYREILLLNPLVHAIESIRGGFSEHYHLTPEIDLFYLYRWAGLLVFFGLVLHRRFALTLVMK